MTLNHCFKKHAKIHSVLTHIKKQPKTEHSGNKPWFNRECKNARNIYHKIRRLYNKYKTNHFKNLLKLLVKIISKQCTEI